MGITQRTPAVVVYVRHRHGCTRKHHGDQHRGCDCPKWVRYSQNGQHRKPAARSWEQAESYAKQLQAKLDVGEVDAADKSTIKGQVATYLSKKETENVGAATLRKLRYQLNKFADFMTERQKFYPHQITREDVIEFRTTWKHKNGTQWGDLTRIRAQGNLRGFIKFGCTDNRAELLDALSRIRETKEGKAQRQPNPFTDAELTKLLNQVAKTFAREPEKIALHQTLIRLLSSTGLAIIDGVQLQRSALMRAKKTGVLEVVRQKTNRPARIPIDSSLLGELLEVLNGNPKYVFWSGEFLAESETKRLRAEMVEVMEGAGLYSKGNVFHRFRDSVVDFWIGQGWATSDIARALGDTVAIVEKHYEQRLSERVQKRMADLPTRVW